MANIAAGYEQGGHGLVECLHTAKGAVGKVRSLLHVAKDLGHLSEQRRADLLEQLSTIARQLGGFIRYLEKGPAPRAHRRTAGQAGRRSREAARRPAP